MDMDGWFYFRGHREISIRDDLTIQHHDPRGVGGSQQRLTPGVSTHDLVGKCAAERLGLPWLQHTCTYKHTDKCRCTQSHAYWNNKGTKRWIFMYTLQKLTYLDIYSYHMTRSLSEDKWENPHVPWAFLLVFNFFSLRISVVKQDLMWQTAVLVVLL